MPERDSAMASGVAIYWQLIPSAAGLRLWKTGGCSRPIAGSAVRRATGRPPRIGVAGVPTSSSDVMIPAGVSVTVSTGYQSAGTITTDPTATLSIDGGTLAVGSDSTIAGNLNLCSGEIIAGTGATLTLAGADNQWTGGTVAGSFAGSGSGTVSLSGPLGIDSAGATFDFPVGMFQWNDGNIEGNSYPFSLLTNTGSLTLSGTDTLANITLNNSGTIVDGCAADFDGNGWNLASEVVVNNLSGGIIDVDNGDQLYGSDGYINNEAGATFEDTGTTTVDVDAVFNNQGGTVAATAGTLNFDDGGTDTGGAYDPSTGATIDLGNPNESYGYYDDPPVLTGTFTGTGGGSLSLGTLGIAVGSAGATFDFPAGLFNWSTGGIYGSTSDAPAVLTNAGTITITEESPSISGNLVFDNLAGGLIDLAGEDSVYFGQYGQQEAIDNEAGATFESTAPEGSVVEIPFNNLGGTVSVAAGYGSSLGFNGGGTDTGGIYEPGADAEISLGSVGGNLPILTGTYTGSGAGDGGHQQ